MSYTNQYYPRRPVKSFQDLEVYQKLLAVSVAVAKRIKSEKVVTLALDLPVKIATAHSLRFGDQKQSIEALEVVMLNCNLLVVYLEQYRDIENKDIESEFFEEQIKSLFATRTKVLRLQRSWLKFMNQKGEKI